MDELTELAADCVAEFGLKPGSRVWKDDVQREWVTRPDGQVLTGLALPVPGPTWDPMARTTTPSLRMLCLPFTHLYISAQSSTSQL